jgi:thiol:disulfide interchange protein DsbA
MKRVARAAVALLSLLPLACSAADAPTAPAFELNKQYKEVMAPQLPADATRIEVAEVFRYGCPHCYQFDSYLDKWIPKLPKDVNFIRRPASQGFGSGAMQARAYYTAQLLGIGDRVHKPLFDAIHEKNKPMATPEELRELFVSAGGIKAEDFDGTFKSFAVDSRVQATETAIANMGITNVPTMVVEGRYYSNGSLAGNYDTLLKVVDFLVDKARKERERK